MGDEVLLGVLSVRFVFGSRKIWAGFAYMLSIS